MFEYILFDLDGTLTDPKEGICKSVQYALKKAGIDEPNLDVLEPFIGPPLIDSFKEFYHMDEEAALKAVADYRERFSVTGLYENELYDGMDDMLLSLKDKGIKLAVASSKPEIFVKKILKHFKIAKYFDVVVGSELDGTRSEKSMVVEEALRQLFELKENEEVKAYLSNNKDIKKLTAMVGDRKFDIVGAKNFGITPVGVRFGYAPKGELEAAGAAFIAKDVNALGKYLLDENSQKKKKEKLENKSSFFKSINVVLPLVWYYFMMMLVSFAGVLVTNAINNSGDTDRIIWLAEHTTVVSGVIYIVSIVVTIIVLCLLFGKTDDVSIKVNSKVTFFIIPAGFIAIGLNVILTAMASVIKIDALKYQESDLLRNLPMVLGLLIFVLASPLLEELLFRWLIYGRMKKMLNTSMAVIMSALFFGFYHGNLLQGIYAFIMGIIMAIIYEKAGTLIAPYLFHVGANLFVYLTRFLSDGVKNIIGSVPVAIVILVVGLIALVLNYKMIESKEN